MLASGLISAFEQTLGFFSNTFSNLWVNMRMGDNGWILVFFSMPLVLGLLAYGIRLIIGLFDRDKDDKEGVR